MLPIKWNLILIRICGDFRVTYNKCSSPAVYPIPRIEYIHASLRGCTIFSTLDMSQAYFQIPIHPDSQQWLTLNTHLGLCVFTRCPNGIYTAPLFQIIMTRRCLVLRIQLHILTISWFLVSIKLITMQTFILCLTVYVILGSN